MTDTLIRALEREILDDIPLARAMQLRIAAHAPDRLAMSAPLAPNINDKGCAFGGSLASLLTLSCWALVVLRLRAAGEDCDVYVQDSQLRYLAPVWGELRAESQLANGENWDDFFAMLGARGKGRLRVVATVADEAGKPATTLDARFVALRREAKSSAA
ncbi:thioesterase domain-containing protein [Tahibacter caeni]|uniref:thioesterase domain-containing protein n=1 Tax=Tahibacter caeni TaxID=1453545 RepID=UPI0021483979|nr:thioesterase domain-containing protein [Tahibacter caeni]